MVIAPVLWSTAGVVTRHLERATSFETVFWRSLFACAFVAGFLFLRKQHFRLKRPMLVSAAMWAVMFTAFMLALQLTSTANTLVVMSVAPLLTALLARAFLNEPIAVRTWLAVSAAALGIAWMFSSGLGAQGARDYFGMTIATLVPVASAINVIALRASAATVDLRPAVMLGAALSCLVAAPFAFPLQATGKDLLLLGFLGVFQLGLPCVLLVIASRALMAPEIALLGLLEVLLGPLWAWLGAGERPASGTLVGGAIVIGALILNELSRGEPHGLSSARHYRRARLAPLLRNDVFRRRRR
jgi:drug/metabolite transporter (DMT)-like permease